MQAYSECTTAELIAIAHILAYQNETFPSLVPTLCIPGRHLTQRQYEIAFFFNVITDDDCGTPADYGGLANHTGLKLTPLGEALAQLAQR